MPDGGEGNGTPLQYSCLENPMDGGPWWAAVHGVAKSRTRLSNFTFTFHFHALEKEMATHSSVPSWRIPGTGEPGGLPSMGSHRVGHDWSDLAAAAAVTDGAESGSQCSCMFTLMLLTWGASLGKSRNSVIQETGLSAFSKAKENWRCLWAPTILVSKPYSSATPSTWASLFLCSRTRWPCWGGGESSGGTHELDWTSQERSGITQV